MPKTRSDFPGRTVRVCSRCGLCDLGEGKDVSRRNHNITKISLSDDCGDIIDVALPKDDETRLFGDGRLLILSRVFADGTTRGVGWHGINDAVGEVAKATGGESVYVRWNPGEGVKWDFAK